MRLPSLTLSLCFALLHGSGFVAADTPSGSGGLYPPGLLPLINRANVLLSTGHFGEAAKIYTEAIEQSPTDYLLYYKRATAYLSLQRHAAALEDFDHVLSLTSNTFDNAHLSKSRIHLREGHLALARESLDAYKKGVAAKKGKDKSEPEVEELDKEIKEAERLKEKTSKERKAQLWTACVDTASQALRHASHSAELRTWRAECALAAGDIESSIGDLTRLSHLLQPSTTLLTHIFRLSYFLLPPSPTPMSTLKQCLHFDPDSKPCLQLHRLVKNFDKSFAKLDELLGKEDWKGVTKLLMGPGGGKTGELWKKYEEALESNLGETDKVLPLVPLVLVDPSASTSRISNTLPLPNHIKLSHQRQHLVRSLCKAYTHLAEAVKSSEDYKKQRGKWCEELLTLDGCAEDVDGLVGRAESLLDKSEFEEAVRMLEKAFESSGRSDRKIHQTLQKAQKLLKQSKQKDYYKIIGVSRDADDKTIKKAYRKAAKLAHPDKGGSEAKMAALNEAYEVLSNPELRQRFDAGEDPMDPSAGAGPGGGYPGGHPFAQFFQGGFPGGGQQFFQGGGFPGGGSGGFQFHFSHGR